MNKIDLNALPLNELIRIRKEIDRVIDKVQRSEKIALRKKMEVLAAESGFELGDIIASESPFERKRIIKPKYLNPENQDQTWTGRGRKPKWVVYQLEQGKQLDDLLINKKG